MWQPVAQTFPWDTDGEGMPEINLSSDSEEDSCVNSGKDVILAGCTGAWGVEAKGGGEG